MVAIAFSSFLQFISESICFSDNPLFIAFFICFICPMVKSPFDNLSTRLLLYFLDKNNLLINSKGARFGTCFSISILPSAFEATASVIFLEPVFLTLITSNHYQNLFHPPFNHLLFTCFLSMSRPLFSTYSLCNSFSLISFNIL